MTHLEMLTFLAVVKMNSISKAAEFLYVTQPTVSYRLVQLENELGVQLIVRKKGHNEIELTPDGERFAESAFEWEASWKKLSNFRGRNPLAALNIGCHDSLNVFLFSKLLKEMLSASSHAAGHATYRLESYGTGTMYSLLERGDLDVAFLRNPTSNKNLKIHPLFSEEFCVLVPHNSIYPNEPIRVEDLDAQNEIYLSFSWKNYFIRWHETMFQGQKPPRVSINAASTLPAFLTDPSSWAIAPITVAIDLQEKNNFLILPFAANSPPDAVTFKITSQFYDSSSSRNYFFETQLSRFLDERPYLKRLDR